MDPKIEAENFNAKIHFLQQKRDELLEDIEELDAEIELTRSALNAKCTHTETEADSYVGVDDVPYTRVWCKICERYI